MAGFASIIGHDRAIDQLRRLLGSGALPHSLLLVGPSAVGKKTVARHVAMALACQRWDGPPAEDGAPLDETIPCGRCPACRAVARNSWADCLWVEPEGEEIKVDQARQVIEQLALKPYAGRWRTVVLAEAHRLNISAANALLKVLEEPPPATLLILTATGTQDLLPTIVSRCQQIRLGQVAPDIMAPWLAGQRPQLGLDRAQVVAAIADGRPAAALDMADGALEERDRLVAWAGLDAGADRPVPVADLLALAAELESDDKRLETRLAVMETWLRDLAVCRHAPQRVINRDRQADLVAAAGRLDEALVLDLCRQVDRTRRLLRSRANKRLALESLALCLGGRLVPFDRPSLPA